MWLFVAALFIILYPIYESRTSVYIIITSMILDLSGKPPDTVPPPMDKTDLKLQATAHNEDIDIDDAIIK